MCLCEYTSHGHCGLFRPDGTLDQPPSAARIAEVRATPAGKGLKNVFIMTNGKVPWVDELKREIARMGGWEKVASSRDMQLSWEQQFVAQSVDMLVGQRAQVIIGNGVRHVPLRASCLVVERG